MNYHITIGDYELQTIQEVEIKRSVETLSDTATISLPAFRAGKQVNVEDRIAVGNAVTIKLGYGNGDNIKTEFNGYLNAIQTDDETLKLECIDALYHFKVNMPDEEVKKVSLKDLLMKITKVANASYNTQYTVECDYTSGYDKFVISHATCYDVLKKIQDDFKANIYFDGNTLHCHAPYSKVANSTPVVYDFAVNIEKSDLKYVKQTDKKLEVEVIMQRPDGTSAKATFGTTGCEKKTEMLSGVDESTLSQIAKDKYNVWCYDGYEGNFTGWLVPYVEPTYKVQIRDNDFTWKNGDYYVIATDVSFSESGGKRKVILGRKITSQ